MKRERSEGCLFGTAIGDALAAPTEFIRDLNAMEKRFGSREKFELIGDPALVTDDTQMALAVAEALIASETPYTAQRVEGPIRAAFVEWMDSPE
ncbi:MAG: ADP-ribosylglycohydrolase family protein, partial [bacterium]